MNKKRTILIFLVIAVVLVVAGVFVKSTFFPTLAKIVSVRGYEINIPTKWSSDSKGNIYDQKGNLVGSFTLRDSDVPIKLESDGVRFGEYMTKHNDFLSDSVDSLHYIAWDLPNPEPYGAELVFYSKNVREVLADNIAKTFKIPEIGTNPPQKNIKLPEDIQNTMTKTVYEDGSILVKNSALLSEFSKKLLSKESFGINVIVYKEKDRKREVSSWKYIECDGGKGYLYTYYDKGDGTYTYDNNAHIFSKLLKDASEENSLTAYSLITNENELVHLIDFPFNKYRDNAEELATLKTDNAKSADIQNILDKILSKDELKHVSFYFDGKILNIEFSKGISSDEIAAYSHSAIIFSLATNIDTINVSYSDANFTFKRSEIEKVFDINGSTAIDGKTFADYAEQLEEMNINKQDGVEIYSGTVVVSYYTVVTHPKTGDEIFVGPYAEKYGGAQFLDKPISCVITRSGKGYILTATCNGRPVTKYPLENDAKLNWAIGIINAYS